MSEQVTAQHQSQQSEQSALEGHSVQNSLSAPGTVSQLQQQEAANSSPNVHQLMSYQDGANGSPQVQQLQSLQNAVGSAPPVQLFSEEGQTAEQEPMQLTVEGALVGGAAGAVVGAGVGALVGGGPGALIGGLIGGVGGAIAGGLLTQKEDVEPFLAELAAKTTAERQAILNDEDQLNDIRGRFEESDLVLVMNALMEGSSEWENPTGNDFYEHFVTNAQDTPLATTASMNCWESILYSAFLAGEINGDFIRDFYAAAFAGADANQLIWQQLGYDAALPEYPATVPTAGQFLFFIEAGRPYPGHIALSHGGDNAISLWSMPNNIDTVQRIQINELVGPNTTVLVGNPIW